MKREPGPPRGRARTPRTARAARPAARRDAVDESFGPGAGTGAEDAPASDPGDSRQAGPRGPIPGFDCGGGRCVFAPATSLVLRFAAQLGPRHIRSLSHAASSGIELMKALRDFLDEEIAIAERAAGKGGGGARYSKISVE